MRVGIVSLIQECNTFVRESTKLAHFQQDTLLAGSAIIDQFAEAPHEIGGFLAGLREQGIEAVPVFAARALPHGVIEADVFDQLLSMMFDRLAGAGQLDGVLAAVHGATVAENQRDADGYWLTRLRAALGSTRPIVATLDAHANLSRAMVDATDALIAYRTNPHVDQFDRGREAAELMAAILGGNIRPTQYAVMPPMAINIECQQTGVAPCRDWIARADSIRCREGVVSASLLLGFPYADVEEMGSAAVVVCDNHATLAASCAQELGAFAWSRREDFRGRLASIKEALDGAAEMEGPVLLLDMGDNVGGGGPADGTALAHAINERGMAGSFICLYDPAAVEQVASARPGDQVRLEMGGKSDPESGGPFAAEVWVEGVYEGQFSETEARHGGFTSFDQGRTAVVQTERGLTLMLNSRRTPPWSLQQLTSCGLCPATFHLIVAKGVVAPMAAYQGVCRNSVRVNTPGVTSADMTQFNYRHRRRPMFPFEEAPVDG